MALDAKILDRRLREIKDRLSIEYATIRTGRASPSLLDNVSIDSYGTKTPLSHAAAIAIENPKTLKVMPWDKSLIKAVESAIVSANLGVSTAADGAAVRVIFPDLTSERRKLLIKTVAEKLEEAKIAWRRVRDQIWGEIQEKERSKEISEDEKFRLKKEMERKVEEGILEFESTTRRKTEELSA